jgi:hypothetical protein
MTGTVRSADAHRDRHRWLQRALDELLRDYLAHHADAINAIETLTVEQLLTWATLEAARPTEPFGEHYTADDDQ